jgi:hypothetical protein
MESSRTLHDPVASTTAEHPVHLSIFAPLSLREIRIRGGT